MKYLIFLLLKYLRFLLFTLFLIVHFMIGAMVWTEFIDLEKNHFKTYNDMVDAGYLKKRWLPLDFPTNTFNIKIKQDASRMLLWVKSEFVGDIKFGNRTLTPVKKSELPERMELPKKRILEFKKVNSHAQKVKDTEYIAIDYEKKIFFYYRE